MTAPAIRVILADDERLVRAGFRMILGAEPGIAIVAEAADGREAVELSLRCQPDVVIIDVVMPRLDGILATRQILEADPGQLVVVLTGAGEDELGVEALRAGAVDAVPKDTDLDVLARALAAARRVEAPIAHAAE